MITKNTGYAARQVQHTIRGVKIAVIEPSGMLYGSEYCLLDIMDGLQKSHYSWHVFLPRGKGFDQILIDRGIACDFLLPRDLKKMTRWRKFPAYAEILLRLLKIKPDLLYVNQAGSLRSASLYANLLKLPVVCQVQTLEDARWLCHNRELHKVVQAFICNSLFVAAETGCDESKKCILYYGQPSARLEHAEKACMEFEGGRYSGNSDDEFVVGILGRIAVSKGHYVLLEAARQLQHSMPSCRFVVIGDGLTQEDGDEFKRAVTESGLEGSFEFRGYRKDVATELARLHVLAIPSLAEPFGRIFIDAAEHGVPAVVSDGGGLGELSKRFDVGVRFTSGDAGELARKLMDAARNYEEFRYRFVVSATSMLRRLSMQPYLAAVERILDAAAARKSSCEVWLGDG